MLNFKNIFGIKEHEYCYATIWIRTNANDLSDYIDKCIMLIRAVGTYKTKMHAVKYLIEHAFNIPDSIWIGSYRVFAVVELKYADAKAIDKLLNARAENERSEFDFVVGYCRTV